MFLSLFLFAKSNSNTSFTLLKTTSSFCVFPLHTPIPRFKRPRCKHPFLRTHLPLKARETVFSCFFTRTHLTHWYSHLLTHPVQKLITYSSLSHRWCWWSTWPPTECSPTPRTTRWMHWRTPIWDRTSSSSASPATNSVWWAGAIVPRRCLMRV